MTDVAQTTDPTEQTRQTRPSRLPFRRPEPNGPEAEAGTPLRFTIRLSRTDDGQLRVEALGPPGRAEALSALPEPPMRGAALEHGDPEAADFLRERRGGVLLYNVIFVPHVLRLLEESRLAAGEAPLPIDLVIDDPTLTSLPWELLRDPETDRFLALSESALFSRVAPEQTTAQPLLPVPSIGSLKVAIVAPALGEAEIALAQSVGGDKRVDVSLSPVDGSILNSPNVVQISGDPDGITIPASARLLVIDGDAGAAEQALIRVPAVVALPAAMTAEERATFLSAFYVDLAAGEPLDQAITGARRVVAQVYSATELDWALPILITRGKPEPAVLPPRAVAGAVGRRAKDETVGWFKTTMSGVVSSVVLFLVGLTLFRLGVSGTPSLSFSIISPFALYASFKALVLELSTFREYFLLGAAVVFALLAVGALFLWRRKRALMLPAGQHDRWIFDLAAPVSSLRSVSFFSMAALTILGAFVYQQYLWNVLLPIDDDALGIAITRDTAAASFSDELADSLFADGQARDIVIRELPVKFDARDTDKARSLGQRIGAEAVVIYRSETDQASGTDQYVAYVVFTDPTVGFSVASAGNAAEDEPESGTQRASTLDVRTEATIPVLRTEQLTELVDSAAGIIAYQEGRYRDAIEHLSRVGLDGDPNTGIVAYYLARSFDLDGQYAAATPVYEQAIAYYEARQDAPGGLGPQDVLLLVESYLQRGKTERFIDNWDGALAWYQKGVALREDALARADDLDRPADVQAVFGRLYAEMADVYRIIEDDEQHRFWKQRALEEADAINAESGDDDATSLNQEAMTRYFAGDCVGALAAEERAIAADPDARDAYIGASAIAIFQGRGDVATGYLLRGLERRPDDVTLREQLGLYSWMRVLGTDGYYEPAYLSDVENLFRENLAIDPTNPTALRQLADASTWRADGEITDFTALLAGDDFSVTKSQTSWRDDRERVDAALAAYAVAIDQHRIIATELEQGNVAQELTLATAYFNRQQLLYNVLINRFEGEIDEQMQRDGEQMLADAAQIREWTARAIAGGPGVTRVQQLQGWSLFLKSIDREWGWYAFFVEDQDTASRLQTEYVEAFTNAFALLEAEPLTTPDELSVGAQIYFSGAYIAVAFENDPAKSSEYQQTALDLSMREVAMRDTSTSHIETTCGEEQERQAGLAAEAEGDLDAAARHYAAALAVNPVHVPTLLNASALEIQRGDATQAAAHAEVARQVDPQNADAWERLAVATLALGDAVRSDTAWSRYFELAAGRPAQHRLYTLSTAVADLTTLVEDQPALAPVTLARVQPIADAAAALDVEAAKSYQLPALYADLGRLALWAKGPEQAEPLLHKALSLDPHQPQAHSLLVLSALTLGRDGAPETAAAIAETQDPFWAETYTYDAVELLRMLDAETTDYLDRFADRSSMVQPFRDAVDDERMRVLTASG